MRQLNKYQKGYLNRCLINYKHMGIDLYTADDLVDKDWEWLQQLNDTEILWQEVTRYISDIRMEQ